MARGIVSKDLGTCPGAKNDAAATVAVRQWLWKEATPVTTPLLTAAQPPMTLIFDLNQDSP